MDSSANRSEVLILILVGTVPVVAGTVIVAVGGVVRSLPIMGIGFFIIGLENAILGSIEITNWRGFAIQDGQYARHRRIAGWLALASGVILLLVGTLSLVIA